MQGGDDELASNFSENLSHIYVKLVDELEVLTYKEIKTTMLTYVESWQVLW